MRPRGRRPALPCGWPVLVAIMLVGALVGGGACSFGGPDAAVTTTTRPAEPVLYVSLGAGETVEADVDADQAAYPRRVFRDHLPPQTVFHNLADGGAGLEEVLGDQVERAVAMEPTVVTVWLDAERFGSSPTDVVSRLVEEGVGRLVDTGARVAVTTGTAAVDGFGAAVRSATEGAGAVYVDLAGASGDGEVARSLADVLVDAD